MKMHLSLHKRSALTLAAAAAVVALAGCNATTANVANVAQAVLQAPVATEAATTPAVTAPTAPTASTLGATLAQQGSSLLMNSLNVPATGTASNAAGVLTYCAKNNYLNPDKAGDIANQLLTSLGIATPAAAAQTQDQGYLQGVAGMIVSPTGQLFSLDQIKGNVKDKACEFILDKSKAFL